MNLISKTTAAYNWASMSKIELHSSGKVIMPKNNLGLGVSIGLYRRSSASKITLWREVEQRRRGGRVQALP